MVRQGLQTPADELQCNAVTGKERSQMPADELVQCSAVIGKARSLIPTEELQALLWLVTQGYRCLLVSYNGTAVTSEARSQMPTDGLQSNAVTGKEMPQMPADELQCNCCNL